MHRVVVIGASGHFGGRICRRLLHQPNTELVVTSRNPDAADRVARELGNAQSAVLDQSSAGFASSLAALEPDTVIHTAGPYQGQDYRVAEACIACGSNYLDLADGREFVAEFVSLDPQARSADVLLVSGASTLPGVSSAVLDEVRGRFDALRSIEISIAPAHQTPRGAGTVAAVLSYCGKPFETLEHGEMRRRFGWQDLRRQRYPELGRRLSGACDVPDLRLFAKYVDGIETVTFHAALEAEWEQIVLWMMAWATRIGMVSDWARWAPGFQRMSDRLIALGSTTGGMQMRFAGTGIDGDTKVVTWNLTARNNHGPEIPCVPALVLARKLASQQLDIRGAMPCLGMISLAEFDGEVADLDIHWSIDEAAA